MKDKNMIIEVDNIQIKFDDAMRIMSALIADDSRLAGMPGENVAILSLIALKDYIYGISCKDGLSKINYKEVNDVNSRPIFAAMTCVYCEMRYRATRGHNAELAEEYREYHDTVMKDCFRTMKKEEKSTFLEALIA